MCGQASAVAALWSDKVVLIQSGLHMSLLFAMGAADFAADVSHRREPRGFIEPAGQRCVSSQRLCLAHEDDEDRLRDFLGSVGVARVAQRDGIDLVHMARDERGKGGLGVLIGVLP